MSEENQPINEELDPELTGSEGIEEEGNRITRVSGMYQDYFLDYASYVILERATPRHTYLNGQCLSKVSGE